MSDKWTALWSSTRVKNGSRKQILIATTPQKNSATTDEEISTESHSLEKERYFPESEQSWDTCRSGLTTGIPSWKVWMCHPESVWCTARASGCVGLCTLVCQSSLCLRSSLRIPLKVLLSLSSQTNDTTPVSFDFIFPALVLISLSVCPCPSSALASHLQSSSPTCPSCRFPLSVTCYLSLPVNYYFLCRVPA